MSDTELYKLIPVLEGLAKVEDVRVFLEQFVHDD